MTAEASKLLGLRSQDTAETANFALKYVKIKLIVIDAVY